MKNKTILLLGVFLLTLSVQAQDQQGNPQIYQNEGVKRLWI